MDYSDDDQLLDRRENPRINWIDSEVQVVIIPSNTGYKVLGWVLDISPGGFKVRTEVPQKVEQIFLERREIHFETSGDFFELKGRGRVIWTSSDWNTVGIRFDRLDEDSRKSLYGFLGRLAAD